MALPQRSPEQQQMALALAAGARKVAADLKGALRRGEMNLGEALAWAAGDSWRARCVRKLRVSALLEALPGIGRVKAERIMADLGIAENRRVGGLGPNQHRALVDYFNK